jgi:MFS family permease
LNAGPTEAVPAEQSRLAALNRPILVLLLLQLMGGMLLAPQRTFFPIYLTELGVSAVTLSALAAARQLTGLVASLIGGSLSDTMGKKWTLLAGEVGFALGCLAFLSPRVGWVALLWAASGFGLGLHTLGGQSYLVHAARANSLGMTSALYNWGYTLGGALSSPVVGFLLDRWEYSAFGIAGVIFSLATITTNLLALPKGPDQRNRAPREKSKVFGYGQIATRQSIIVLAMLRFLPTFYWGMALILIPLLLDRAGASKTEIALYATISQALAALAQIATGRAADRLGIHGPTVGVLSTFVASILGLATAPGRVWSLALFGSLTTAAAWSLSTLLPLWAARVARPDERGRVLGWVHLWWNVAMIAGSLAAGPLLARSPSLPFVVAAALNVGTIALVVMFLNRENWAIGRLEG